MIKPVRRFFHPASRLTRNLYQAPKPSRLCFATSLQQRLESGGSSGEPRGQRDQQAVVVAAGGAVVSGDPGEVPDVLPQQRVDACGGRSEHPGSELPANPKAETGLARRSDAELSPVGI
jgi:hypothetical protein